MSSSAALLSTQLYAPYGAARFTAGTPDTYTSKGYTGQYNDSVSGLDYYNARYYDPVSGVFLSADTVEGNDSGMNPYAYAGGNPITRNDPSGHDYPDDTWQKIARIGIEIGLGVVVVVVGGVLILHGLISSALQPKSGPNYPANGPQPTPTPTPTTATTPEPTPQTDTNGAMCRPGGCYDLTKDEGTSVIQYAQRRGGWYVRQSTAHTVAQHVTISDAELRQRANAIGKASKFYSLTSAEWAVEYAMDHMGQAEKVDLAGLQVGQTLTIQPVNTGEIIGYGYVRGNPNMIIETGVEVVFMMGYDNKPFVLTSYPVYMQPPPSPPHAPGHGFAP